MQLNTVIQCTCHSSHVDHGVTLCPLLLALPLGNKSVFITVSLFCKNMLGWQLFSQGYFVLLWCKHRWISCWTGARRVKKSTAVLQQIFLEPYIHFKFHSKSSTSISLKRKQNIFIPEKTFFFFSGNTSIFYFGLFERCCTKDVISLMLFSYPK